MGGLAPLGAMSEYDFGDDLFDGLDETTLLSSHWNEYDFGDDLFDGLDVTTLLSSHSPGDSAEDGLISPIVQQLGLDSVAGDPYLAWKILKEEFGYTSEDDALDEAPNTEPLSSKRPRNSWTATSRATDKRPKTNSASVEPQLCRATTEKGRFGQGSFCRGQGQSIGSISGGSNTPVISSIGVPQSSRCHVSSQSPPGALPVSSLNRVTRCPQMPLQNLISRINQKKLLNLLPPSVTGLSTLIKCFASLGAAVPAGPGAGRRQVENPQRVITHMASGATSSKCRPGC